MSLSKFHPAVASWFNDQFSAPTDVQCQAWSTIAKHESTLIAAPTGSGKTLAAFLSAINGLIETGITQGLTDETQVLYVSPLKALSNDIQKNLQLPINGIRDSLLEHGLADVEVRAWVRTGDTPQSERAKMKRKPPHIIVTTPESLYILLTSVSGRQILKTVSTVIVDEIHALAGNKRGAHLAVSLERLSFLCTEHQHKSPIRIGLSATQKPIEQMAMFLVGNDQASCNIVDTGHARARDLAICVPTSPLEAIMANEVWEDIYDQLENLINSHTTTLIFVNTRRLAERAAHNLAERIGEQHITAHHGSLAREHRLQAEQRLKGGKLRALVATASLELGIDIGDIDLVCQLGSPHSIATFLQRVGRSGHAVGTTPKGRLFPLSRDDLVECSALLMAIDNNELDRIKIPDKPLDALAQQIVAEVANRDWDEQALFQLVRKAYPYRNLDLGTFTELTRMLADGFSTRRGRRSAYLHRDGVNKQLRARRGARLVALTNGGAIPDLFDYDVILQPEDCFIGNLNEDFAFESLPGDIFQLGNMSYRILKIEKGKVYVADAHGQPPNLPFWMGEAPGRTDELSLAVSDFRQTMSEQLDLGIDTANAWLAANSTLPDAAIKQISLYLAAAKAALGLIPTHQSIVFERFFDDVGDMHFVIHAPFGSRINRAWGLALRKRFCRKFNFELQAAAMEDSIVLSLGPTHSFPMAEVANYLKSQNVRQLLIQALLDAPVFATRWRWNANISLAVPRFRNGKRVPAQFQRSNAEDLIAVVFPDQIACFENIKGEREIPDHPLVNQTIKDCLYDNMDIEGLESLLRRLEAKQIEVTSCELTSPSPLAQEIINANPFAFLDDAPAEERRTLAIQQRRHIDPQSAADLGRLDPLAITQVCQEAWPEARNSEELHDALVVLGFMTDTEIKQLTINDTNEDTSSDYTPFINQLIDAKRLTLLSPQTDVKLWVSAERLAECLSLFPNAVLSPKIDPVDDGKHNSLTPEQALVEIIRSRLEGLGPITATVLAKPLGLASTELNIALLTLEKEGFAIQGHFIETLGSTEVQWCDRRLLARIHRYTLKTLRREINPVSPATYMSFLFHWQHLDEKLEGKQGLVSLLDQLEGYSLPAAAWEKYILPARLDLYIPEWLDNLCVSGQFQWLRLNTPLDQNSAKAKQRRKLGPLRTTPLTLLNRLNTTHWRTVKLINNTQNDQLSDRGLNEHGLKIKTILAEKGAMFFTDLIVETQLIRTQVEAALAELTGYGLITADSFAGLRALITPSKRRRAFGRHSRIAATPPKGIEDAGRWSLLPMPSKQNETNTSRIIQYDKDGVEHIARVLLRRYGIVFRKILDKENNIPPWRELIYVFHRMEARGEIRGGRFVSGFSGEQFALPEAVAALRNHRKQAADSRYISLCAVDPLNLTGIVTPGQRVPAIGKNRILYCDGTPIATSIAGNVTFLTEVDPQQEWEARNRLIQESNPTSYITKKVPSPTLA